MRGCLEIPTSGLFELLRKLTLILLAQLGVPAWTRGLTAAAARTISSDRGNVMLMSATAPGRLGEKPPGGGDFRGCTDFEISQLKPETPGAEKS